MACWLAKAPRLRSAGRAGILAGVAVLLLAPAPGRRLVGQQADTARPANENPQARQIAPVMSYVYADWLTRPEREREEQPDRLVAALKIPPGATVVDLGAGVGYFTWRLAKRVGPTGRVIATDIQQGMLELLATELGERGLENVTPVLATALDPGLPENEVDLVLMVDVYHELSDPQLILAHVRRSLKAGGRLAVVEYRKEQPWVPIHPLHKMTVTEVRAEIEPTGFELVEVLEFLPSQHVIIFTPNGD